MKQTTFFSQIVFWGTLLLFLVTFLVWGFFLYFIYLEKEEAYRDKLSVAMHDRSVLLSQSFSDTHFFFDSLLYEGVIGEYLSREDRVLQDPELLAYFESRSNLQSIRDNLLSLYLMDVDGVTLVSTDSSLVGQNYSFRGCFKDAIRGLSGMDVSIGVTSGELEYYFSHPVRDPLSSDIRGVLVLKLAPSFVSSFLSENISTLPSSVVSFVDDFGVVITSTSPDRVFRSVASLSEDDFSALNDLRRYPGKNFVSLGYDQPDLDMSLLPSQNILFVDDVDSSLSNYSLVAAKKLYGTPFSLIVEDVRAPFFFSPFFFLSFGAVFLSFFVTFLLYLFVVWRLSYPLSLLHKSASLIVQGKTPQNAFVSTRNEFYVISQAFSFLLNSLSNSRFEFESHVSERTSALQSTVRRLRDVQVVMAKLVSDIRLSRSQLDHANRVRTALLTSIGEGVLAVDAQGKVLFLNVAAERLLGVRAHGLSDFSLESFFSLKDQEGNIFSGKKHLFYEALYSRKSIDTSLYFVCSSYASFGCFPAHLTITPVSLDNGDILGVVCVFRDITLEKKVDRAKTEFVSLASHQLRTPLTKINWYTELLLSDEFGSLKKTQKDSVVEVRKASQSMVELVGALLNVSRLELGTFSVNLQKVDLESFVKDVTDEFHVSLSSRDIVFSVEVGQGLPGLSVDPLLLKIVLHNLVSNAIKYSLEKSRIDVSVKFLTSGAGVGGRHVSVDSVLFMVKDTGVGIPEAQQDKICTKLFRADNAQKMSVDGTGLGLYIVRSIVDQTGGTIWFVSRENVGTTFFVLFPVSGMSKRETGGKSLEMV
ncbi:MAG: PAS domain-containing protein [Candidatus Moranbacteria bacterium]|nr:PAS domain-containing protein [Candidatus Moranbacteria bacterium]